MDRAYNRVWGRQSGFEIALFAGAGILFEWLKDQRHERERRAMTTGTKT